jgi:AAA domain
MTKEVQRSARVNLIRLADVAAEQVSWLWLYRIPLGKVTVLDGDPGLGKSAMSLDLAARVSRGGDMPDGTPSAAGPSRMGPGSARSIHSTRASELADQILELSVAQL